MSLPIFRLCSLIALACSSYSLHSLLFTFRHDFLAWKQDQGLREVKVMRRYHIQERDDYHK